MKQLIAIKVIILLAVLAIVALSSCSSSKAVYQRGEGWSRAENNSPMTGWSYKEK